jgi:hypothetical protein
MAIRALDCMKDDGRAAIIIGGHTEWDSEGRIKAGKNRIFFSYLYKHYHVADVVNIDGDLYSRQGTSFDVRLILIDGRKATPEGYPPLKDANDTVVKDFETLYNRVVAVIPKKSDNKRLRIVKAKAVAKLKILELMNLGMSGMNKKEAKQIIKEFNQRDNVFTTLTESVKSFKGFLNQCKRAVNKMQQIPDASVNHEFFSTQKNENNGKTYWDVLKETGELHVQDGWFCVDFEFGGIVFAGLSQKALIEMEVFTKEECMQFVDAIFLIDN